WILPFVFFFFFQAEDGIRDLTVTGVQTCALPIFGNEPQMFESVMLGSLDIAKASTGSISSTIPEFGLLDMPYLFRDVNHMMKVRSEERRVGKECRSRWSADREKRYYWCTLERALV